MLKCNKYCPTYGLECFDCSKKGHFCGAKTCKEQRKYIRQVESESETSNSEFSDTSDSDYDIHQDTQTLNRIQYSRIHHTQHYKKS